MIIWVPKTSGPPQGGHAWELKRLSPRGLLVTNFLAQVGLAVGHSPVTAQPHAHGSSRVHNARRKARFTRTSTMPLLVCTQHVHTTTLDRPTTSNPMTLRQLEGLCQIRTVMPTWHDGHNYIDTDLNRCRNPPTARGSPRRWSLPRRRPSPNMANLLSSQAHTNPRPTWETNQKHFVHITSRRTQVGRKSRVQILLTTPCSLAKIVCKSS